MTSVCVRERGGGEVQLFGSERGGMGAIGKKDGRCAEEQEHTEDPLFKAGRPPSL